MIFSLLSGVHGENLKYILAIKNRDEFEKKSEVSSGFLRRLLFSDIYRSEAGSVPFWF